MADKVILEAEIKSNIKKTSEETKELTNNFGAFGITIGSVKEKFSDMAKIVRNGLRAITLQAKLAGLGFKQMFSGGVIKGAKTLFTVIRTGIASTGVGLLVLAFGSLVTYFTQTKKGAEKLKVVFAGLGAAVKVIVDRIADFGGAILKFFKGDFSAAAQEMKAAFTGIGEEIVEDTKLMMELERATNALKDSERDLSVETAQRRAEIEKLKMIAEDVTKNEKERLEAAQQAFDIEQALLDKRVENAEQAVSIAQQQAKSSHSLEEDLDNIRDKEVELANIQAESATKSIELNNKINAIKAEGSRKALEAIEKERLARQEALDEEINAEVKRADGIVESVNLAKERDNRLKDLQVELEQDRDKAFEHELDKYKEQQMKIVESHRFSTEEKEDFEKVVDARIQLMRENRVAQDKALVEANVLNNISALSSLAGAMSTLAGDNKELAIASAIMDTYVGANKAYAQGGPIAGFIGAAAIVAAGLANVRNIMNTEVPGTSSIGSVPTDTTPAPEFFSGGFELQGATPEQQPLQAFVLTDEMTNSQNQLANIRRRATI